MEQDGRLRSLLKECSSEFGILLEADQISQFIVYLQHLCLWNQSVNLTGITVDEEIIIKHFVDSLAVLKVEQFGLGASLLDVGSGAGFPGIPLRIARDDLDVTLIEPTQKKISFLHSIVGVLRLERVKIFYGTLDRFINDTSPAKTFDYITTRALKYDFILKSCQKLLASGGKAILYSTMPIRKLEIEGNWSIENESIFELPKGLGRRVISILSIQQGWSA